jgi:large subunit ribosomal protein L6
MKTDFKNEIELPEGVTAQLEGSLMKIKGQKGEVERNFLQPKVQLTLEGNKITLFVSKCTKTEKKITNSYAAHMKNMISGVQEPHVYKLKICSGHFPMNVSVSGNEVIIKNFFGESVPRKTKFSNGADVKVNGDEIVISSPDKEIAGQIAAKIETLCRVTNKDIRIFQDGCYIIHKSGKDL